MFKIDNADIGKNVMMRFLVCAAPMMVGAPAAAGPWPGVAPVSDRMLSETVGRAGGTTSLAMFVTEQGAAQGQFVGEDQRTQFDNWFANAAANLGTMNVIRR